MNFINNMNFRKSILLLLLVALTIFVSLSAISATDVNNDTVKPCSFSNESGEIDGGAIYAVPYPKNDSIAVVENSTNNTNNYCYIFHIILYGCCPLFKFYLDFGVILM